MPDIKEALSLKLQSSTFPVEIAKVREFATSLLDDSPIYRSTADAKAAGLQDMPVPVTLPMCSIYSEPGTSALIAVLDAGIAKRGMILHGEQEFTYNRPVYVGEKFTVNQKVVNVYEKPNAKGGTMAFFEAESEYVDAEGKVACTSRGTFIERRPAPKA